MNLVNYGITLKLLTEEKIEMIRQWRNDPKIKQYMEYREYITSEMQRKWFANLNNGKDNFYWIIEYQGEEIGLINLKDIDFVNKTAEPGIFIWDDGYIGTEVPLRATLTRNDFAWEVLHLETLHCHILCDNKRAIKYNKALGFKLLPDQEGIYNQAYLLKKEDALKFKDKYKRILIK